ncbi:MAG TPA: DJ-1/PfpI family protein [Candidatus Hydrogenedentes bacterium]|nr:DJ-1/PfpI family protein [Candidatus Hydrogenedentota bacterium]
MKKVLVPLAPGCEELEAVTLIDILRRGGIEVTTASMDAQPVKASRGVVLIADTTLEKALADDAFDMVVIPGGMGGATALTEWDDFIAYLKKVHESGRYVGAICAAPMALGRAGLLAGSSFTAYPGVVDASLYPGSTHTGAAVEKDGRILTSRGPGTALDFALAIIETLLGDDVRDKVEKELVRS